MKLKKRKIVALSIALTLATSNSLYLYKTNTVYAASSTLTEAKAVMSHLSKSIHTNYLGLKNQGTWELYIKQIRNLINKLPSSEKAEGNKLTVEVNKAANLVMAVARINQVEKSMEVNTPRIGNVITWNNYLVLGEQDLAKVDKTEFSKEIKNLQDRKIKSESAIKKIEDEYFKKYSEVAKLIESARKTSSKSDALLAKASAEDSSFLGSCEATEMIKYECRLLLADLGEITLTKDEKDLREAYNKFNKIIDSTGFGVTDTKPSTIEKAIEKEIGNGVKASASKQLENPEKGEELFGIVLSKGSAKLYSIGVVFK